MKYLSTFVCCLSLFLISSSISFSQLVTPTGNFGGAQLTQPNGVTVHNGIIYVVDNSDHEVEMFDLQTKAPLGSFGTNELDRPVGIAISGSTIYVTDFGTTDMVAKFRLSDKMHLGNITHADISNPQGIAIANGTIFVCDNIIASNTDHVDMFDLGTENYLGNFGTGLLNDALYIAIHNGTIYVTESAEVEMFDLNTLASLGNFPTLNINRGIAVGGGFIWVAKTGGGFEIFDIASKTSHGVFGAAEVSGAQGIAFANNMIFVSDELNGDMEMFEFTAAIPTLSQWGLICLGMLLLIMGTVSVSRLAIS